MVRPQRFLPCDIKKKPDTKQRQRYQQVKLPEDFSGEEMALDWTLSAADKKEVDRYRTNFRLFIAVQLFAVRLAQPQSSQARAVGLLGVLAGSRHGPEEVFRGRSGFRGPAGQTLG